MSEQEKRIEQQGQDQEGNTNENYLEAIKNLKANSVPKSEYEKLAAENKKLLNDYINNNPAEVEQEVIDKPVDVAEITKNIFSGEMNNLEYVSNALKLREETLKKTGIDIFVGNNATTPPTAQDCETGRRVAAAFQHCVDYAQGDSQAFTNELQRITNDARIPSRY